MMMTDSDIQPYRGKEPYIFISYAPRNRDEVLEIAARMQAEGCRVWYDGGIDPDTTGADHVTERLAGCDYFIAFLSPEYLRSGKCLDELGYAREQEKNRLLVYLSNVTLSAGLSMRVNRLQAIHKYVYGQEEFYKRLFHAKGLGSCMSSSASGPESASSHTPDSPFEAEGSIPDGRHEQNTAEKPPDAAHSGAVPGKRRKLLLLVPAAVCILLAVLIPSLADNSGTDGQALSPNPADRSGTNEGTSVNPALLPGLDDLSGLSFGMSPDEVREIITAVGATEAATYYDLSGILHMEYHRGTEKFNERNAEYMLACFNPDGLQQLVYSVPQNSGIPQALRDRYGEPTYVYTDHDEWYLEDDFILMYYYYEAVDCITIGFIYASYLDMRGFSWGMSPAEAQEAEAGRYDSLTLTDSGIDSEGHPFQSYEGEWEIYGNPVSQLSLTYVSDRLAQMKYILAGASLDSVAADLTVLYGEGPDQKRDDGAISWQVMMVQPDGSEIPIAFSASRSENGVLMTWQDQDLTGN